MRQERLPDLRLPVFMRICAHGRHVKMPSGEKYFAIVTPVIKSEVDELREKVTGLEETLDGLLWEDNGQDGRARPAPK